MPKRPIRKMRRPQQQGGGGNLLVDVLTFPMLGAPRMVHWLAKKILEEVEREELDEDKLQGQLLELQMRYELGEIDDQEYSEQEAAILDKLSAIREAKEQG